MISTIVQSGRRTSKYGHAHMLATLNNIGRKKREKIGLTVPGDQYPRDL